MKSNERRNAVEWKPLIHIIQLILVATLCQEWYAKDGIQPRLGFFIGTVFREALWIINTQTYVTNHISVVKVMRVFKMIVSWEYARINGPRDMLKYHIRIIYTCVIFQCIVGKLFDSN